MYGVHQLVSECSIQSQVYLESIIIGVINAHDSNSANQVVTSSPVRERKADQR